MKDLLISLVRVLFAACNTAKVSLVVNPRTDRYGVVGFTKGHQTVGGVVLGTEFGVPMTPVLYVSAKVAAFLGEQHRLGAYPTGKVAYTGDLTEEALSFAIGKAFPSGEWVAKKSAAPAKRTRKAKNISAADIAALRS